MSQEFHYFSRGGAFDINLGTQAARLGDYGGYSMKAEAGAIGNSTFIIDDPNATVGNAGDAIRGLKSFYVLETDALPLGSNGIYGSRLYTGYFRERTYRRGTSSRSSLITGVSREIDATIEDLNEQASWSLITDADSVRPAETDIARLQWLLGSKYLPARVYPGGSGPWTDWNEAGYIDTSNPVNMDANDYFGQTPADVIHDCALISGKNWWFGHWEATGHDFFWYANSETSTDYTSPLQISNVLANVDNATTFAPEPDAELRRDPTRTYSGVLVQGSGFHSYRQNLTTGSNYAWRDGSAPNANVKTQAQADAAAIRLLADAANEEDRITCRVRLPSSLVTGIKAGQRINCQFSHLPDYESGAWMRVASLQVQQDEPTDKRYTLGLELTPQILPPSMAQFNWGVNAGAPNPHFLTRPAFGSTVVISLNCYNNVGPLSVPAGWTQISTETGFLPPDENTSLWLYSTVSDGTQTYDETNGLHYGSGLTVRWAIWELDGVGPTPYAVTRVYDRTDTDGMAMTVSTPVSGGGVCIYDSGGWTAFGPLSWTLAAPYVQDELTMAGGIPRMTWGHHVFAATSGSDTGSFAPTVTGVQWGGYLAAFVP